MNFIIFSHTGYSIYLQKNPTIGRETGYAMTAMTAMTVTADETTDPIPIRGPHWLSQPVKP